MNLDIASYYARRASEYEKIYEKPDRQADLKFLRRFLPVKFSNKKLLEVACGTGYWTQYIAETAQSIVAIDINKEVIEIAQKKKYPPGKVGFEIVDIYNLAAFNGLFEAAFGGFIWSHIPVEKLSDFIDVVHERVLKNGLIIFVDNKYVEGSSTPVFKTDDAGNTYQRRRLQDNTEHLVLKNFPKAEEISRLLSSRATDLEYIELENYWVIKYRKA
ncbi:class I SAM-dependent methyltransferase [Fulvivirga imtechensis]|uniref:class I SAM-dependent methyltransferase n=1 Tax=Fulvivirga imtechensis TaxID=881893 RepID=UPI000308599C|nr:class I SAM-dependent methyltransferase [Fulvivirga imtechensis]